MSTSPVVKVRGG